VVSNGLEAGVVDPNGPQLVPGVPRSRSKFDLGGKSCKFREMAVLGGESLSGSVVESTHWMVCIDR
jgi:hypothetical protein